jgi:hypothetical protein
MDGLLPPKGRVAIRSTCHYLNSALALSVVALTKATIADLAGPSFRPSRPIYFSSSFYWIA